MPENVLGDRDRLEASIRDVGGTVVSGPGTFAVVPSSVWDSEDLPDVDLSPCLLTGEDGEAKISVPAIRPTAVRGGVHIVAPEHVAALWYELSHSTLLAEYEHRRKEGLPIPPLVAEAARGVR